MLNQYSSNSMIQIYVVKFQNFARTHSPTRLMSSENTYSLSKEHCNLKYSGECKDCFSQKYFQHHPACKNMDIVRHLASKQHGIFINSFKLYISTYIFYLFIKSINYSATHVNFTAHKAYSPARSIFTCPTTYDLYLLTPLIVSSHHESKQIIVLYRIVSLVYPDSEASLASRE